MADSTTPLAQIEMAQAQKEVTANGLFDAASPATFGGRRAEACTGLTWGYYGGRLGGVGVSNGTLTLTAAVTNYVVANRSTGLISLAAGSPNEWDDTDGYARLYAIVTGASTVSSYQDHRLGDGGLLVTSGYLAKTNEVNSFTAAQAVTPVALTDAATINTNAALSNTFRVTLAGNRTLANPTNLRDGMVLNWKIKQDGTGNRTLAYGTKFKWPSGTAPVLSTAASAVDLLTAQYHADSDILLGNVLKGFA